MKTLLAAGDVSTCRPKEATLTVEFGLPVEGIVWGDTGKISGNKVTFGPLEIGHRVSTGSTEFRVELGQSCELKEDTDLLTAWTYSDEFGNIIEESFFGFPFDADVQYCEDTPPVIITKRGKPGDMAYSVKSQHC